MSLAIALVILVSAARTARVRRGLDAWATRQRHQRRDRARARRVAIAGPARASQYRDAADIVDEIIEADPQAAARFDLEGLLDQFVELARCHHRCVEALRFAPSGPSAFERSRLRNDIFTRRVRYREVTARRIAQLADEIAAIEDLLCLIAHSVSLAPPPLIPDTTNEVDRHLTEIDAVEHALAELRDHEAA